MSLFEHSRDFNNFQPRAFELGLAIWRITKFFPTGETLAKKLKEVSLRIIVQLAQGRINDTILDIEELKIYLAVARPQNWLKPINFDLLKSAYSLLADSLKQQVMNQERQRSQSPALLQIKTDHQTLSVKKSAEFLSDEPSQRQQKIIDYFTKNKQVTVAELLNVLGRVSERTIRNDLSFLIAKDFIKKIGKSKGARYILI